MRLRPAVVGDAPALARIHHAARAAATPGLHEPLEVAAVAEWIAAVLICRHRVCVAVMSDAPIGYCGVTEAGGVLHLYVDPAHHRAGIGRALLEDAQRRAPPNGLHLRVFERNVGARRFYRALGFREAEPGAASGNAEGEPDWFCVWP